ncbi:MAG: type III-A CRISPR-associated protein Cas10/Csm1 [Treponema sp.]|jgi:CRISPR-associated protein Csm1|nr:type III-A CRISPR-associated protein Cas10/Csm1 [Treponema sp.]
MYKEIILAAWLHDVGKFAQRADVEQYYSKDMEGQLCKLQKGGWYSHKHVLYTEGFLQSMKDVLPGELNTAEVIRLAASHHNPSSYHEWLIAHGDRLSSGTDRRDVLPDKAEETPARFYEKPLTHLLSTLHLKEAAQAKRAYSPLKALEEDAILAVTHSKVSKEQYRVLWDQFERDFLALKGLAYPEFMLALDTLLEQYFWCIPSATNDDSDISLYQHSKTTAAFAGALYRYHEARQMETPEALDHDEPKFLFINGDMSGIQKYIFDLKGMGENANLLRARSFELWALSEIMAEHVAAQCNVSREHIVTLAGGKFLLLVPNTDEVRKLVPELRLTLERYVIDEFVGKLAFVLSDGVPASYADVRKEGIQKLLNKIAYAAECAKQRKMQAALMADGQVLGSLYDNLPWKNGECTCCETMPNEFAGNDGNLCRNCADLIDIGRDLLRANKIILKPETLSHFGLMLKIIKRDDLSFGSFINEFKPRYPLMFLPYVAPWKDEARGELKTFEEIADTSVGANKLAMFKADIDNLGLMFTSSMGEGKDNRMSFSRYAQLSRHLHYFFSAYYAQFVRNNPEYTEKIYTVFSGGDDLCVLGAWDTVMWFAADFRKELDRLTNTNPSITLSGGIALASSSLPVRNIAEEANAALDEAKKRIVKGSLVKDGISVFGVTVGWDEYKKYLEYGEQIVQYMKEDKLSSSVVYQMIDLANRAKSVKQGNLRDLVWVSNFNYMVVRNIKDKTVREWFMQLGTTDAIEKSRIAVSYALYKQRKNKEN